MSHTEGLQFVISLLDDVGFAPATQDVGDVVHGGLLVGALDGAQCHLGIARAVKALRRIVAHVAVVAVMVKTLIEVVEQDATAAHAALGKLLHALQLVHVDLHLARFSGKLLQGNDIAIVVEQQGVGGQAVAPRTPDFLVVTLDVARHVAVDDKTHVTLVDAHAEGDRRAHDFQVVVDEVALDAQFLLDAHGGMEGLCVDAQATQVSCHLLGVLATQAVDDAALVAVQADELHDVAQLLAPSGALDDVERDVGTVKRTDEQP